MRHETSVAIVMLVLLQLACTGSARAGDKDRSCGRSAAVSIVRDDWGIAHVHGRTDADAVFGMIYAQAEDDFHRVETNYLNALGRLAEAEGERAIWKDLRMKLFIDPVDLKARYAGSPRWLKSLMDAWSDGLNCYLSVHAEVKPRVIQRFEPWMALSFSEGSISGDIERVSLDQLAAFHGSAPAVARTDDPAVLEPTGSNGFAIAPSNTRDGHALLLINPHTSFFFRSELQVRSDEGLNAYGAATWGQFFIYQGFNDSLGWMNTTSGVDAVDEFAETIVEQDGRRYYRHGDQLRALAVRTIKVPYRGADGARAEKSFTVHASHHGPIVRALDGKWIAVALMHKPVEALSQSFLRTKARNQAGFLKVAELRANSSNATLVADREGRIAYLHPQFVPRRDDRFDYTRPVDGADPATDWQGDTPVSELPNLLDPGIGWLFNTNNWAWSAAGPESLRRERFPRYMDSVGENFRGVHARLVLEGRKDFTLQSLMAAAYDPYMPGFARLIPSLVGAYDATPGSDPVKVQLAGQIALLRAWDYRWSVDSVATTLAVLWAETLRIETKASPTRFDLAVFEEMLAGTTAEQKLRMLAQVSDRLAQDFGSWKTPWGEINRWQRRTADIEQPFSDAHPSSPVPFVSGEWGSLAAYGAKRHAGTKRYYGTKGNSFVAVVEFGDKVRAFAVTAGGVSGAPGSPHFDDQTERYIKGSLREVYFYPEQLQGHTTRRYRPGESLRAEIGA